MNNIANKINIDVIPFDDKQTWNLIDSGFCCGIFQLESPLCQHWLKRIKPKNLWELSGVISLIRPGPLKSGYGEKYVKNKEAGQIESFDNEVVDETFQSTEGVLLYQEQIMQLGAKLAWSHLPEKEKLINVDLLRKAVGKKNQQKILEIGKLFLEGCAKNSIDEKLSTELFEVIKNSGRYAFNLSHSMQYAHLAYKTAYLKTHHPLQFISTYLTYAKEKLDKWEEIDKIANESKYFDIKILSPNFNLRNFNFKIESNAIRYGLGHIKYGISKKVFRELDNVPIINHWHKFLLLTCSKVYGCTLRSDTTISLCSVGAFSDTGLSRTTLLSLYSFVNSLTPKQQELFLESLSECPEINEFPQFIKKLFEDQASNRYNKILSSLAFFQIKTDNPAWIATEERNRLGVVITATSLEGKTLNTTDTCADCHATLPPKTYKDISAIINNVILTTVKKGKSAGATMARITVSDLSGKLDNLPVFPEAYEAYNSHLIENNTVQLGLEMGKTGWIVQSVQQIY